MKPAPRRVWLPWLLLLVPTLLIGAVALGLLWQEQRRIDNAAAEVRLQAEAATRARAQVAADNIELLVSEIRDGLMRELAETPDADLEALLANWPQTNPLVAETFLWRPDQAALAWPPADTVSRREFRQRHATLFAPGQRSLTAALRKEQEESQQQIVAQEELMTSAQSLPSSSNSYAGNAEVASNQALRLDVQRSARVSANAAKNMVSDESRMKEEIRASEEFEQRQMAAKKIEPSGRRRAADEERAKVQAEAAIVAQMEAQAKDREMATADAQTLELSRLAVDERSPVLGRAEADDRVAPQFAAPVPSAPPSVAPAPVVIEMPHRNGTVVPPLMDTAAVPWSEPASGWLGRTIDGSVFFLGWWQPAGGGAVRGVELNLPAVLERAQALVPGPTADGERFALRGPGAASDGASIRIPLSTTLPGWTLVAYNGALRTKISLENGGGFFAVAALLVGAFVASIVAGGAIFFRQAAASEREAALKTSFVSNVSHEMKTPLTTIRMYAEMLADERVTDPAKRSRYFATIGRETARLTRLVNNVLDFGRLEAGRKEYRPEAIPLGPWLARMVETYAPRATEAGVRFVATPAPAGAVVQCDPDSLDQMALNLIDNALKYGGSGAILELHADAVPGGWALVVADRGPGVPAAHRERIFERFHRVDESLTAKAQGAGLGLTIARRLARDQGGNLVCHERTGGGAAFVLSLPGATEA